MIRLEPETTAEMGLADVAAVFGQVVYFVCD